MISLLKVSPKGSAEVLSTAPKCKSAVMCLTEKINVLDSLIQTRVTVLLAVNSVLMNQEHILNKLLLKTGLYVVS